MELNEKNLENVCVLAISGRLDAYSAAEVEKKIDAYVEAGKMRIVLNLDKLEYISSSGLRVFLAQLKKTRKKQGDLKLSCMKPYIREVFDIAGFTQLFNIFETEDIAVTDFNNK